MRIFKSIDEKFKDIGFKKVADDEYIVEYMRKDKKFKYTQTLCICHKENGRHIVQSYDAELMDEKHIGCTNVGLTSYEMKLCIKKMKEKGWYSERMSASKSSRKREYKNIRRKEKNKNGQ